MSLRLLVHDRVRLAISVGGLAFAVLLVLLLRAIMDGTVARSTGYIDHVGADVFVAQQGVEHMSLASSAIPQTLVAEAEGVDGVAHASGIIRVNIVVVGPASDAPAQLIGYEPQRDLGGPWQLASGRKVEGPGEIVLDEVLANEVGAEVGGEVRLGGQPYAVVGLSRGTAAIAGKMAFISLDDAQALLQLPGIISFILLRAGDQVEADALAGALEPGLAGVTVMTRSELSGNDRELLGRLFVAPINVMSTVGLFVGIAVVGLTIYTTTAERLRDFGVLKAIGAPNSYLLRVVALQAIVLAMAGFVLGLVAVYLAGPLIVRFVPDIGVAVRFGQAWRVFAAVLAIACIGAVLPVARISRVDPLMVFRR